MSALRLVIVGAKGRMGQRIDALAEEAPTLEVVGRLDVGSPKEAVREGDVVIDFSQPAGSLLYLAEAARCKKAYVLGTTGFSSEEDKIIAAAAQKIPIVKSSNMSRGVNVFFLVAEQLARALPDYTVRIEETHHIHKKDAPSGTALQAGHRMEAVTKKPVTYQSFREGEVVGDHRIILTGPEDRLELFHHAESRDIFASGALQAARWAVLKEPGLYTMQDVLSQ